MLRSSILIYTFVQIIKIKTMLNLRGSRVRALGAASTAAVNVFEKIANKLEQLNDKAMKHLEENQAEIERRRIENEELTELAKKNDKTITKLRQILD